MSRLVDTQGFQNAGLVRYCRVILDRLALAAERRRQRRALLRLDADQLRDIGLSREDIDAEVGQAFWRF
ncbi:DUF1127 domain-containing protein [Dongia soli]|uniref:DUF1127 domain-containing protein n=1 Tax=Dongia soli TaxID=600628 RepID=A0ABU5EBQ1_9PROT|nr:DUF1127 domain-containing protein [Dongia soli]MDY0882995.1 DUF1127 domain-containing protein [Dongia soli]